MAARKTSCLVHRWSAGGLDVFGPELQGSAPLLGFVGQGEACLGCPCRPDPPLELVGGVAGALPVLGDLGRHRVRCAGEVGGEPAVFVGRLARDQPPAHGLGEQGVVQLDGPGRWLCAQQAARVEVVQGCGQLVLAEPGHAQEQAGADGAVGDREGPGQWPGTGVEVVQSPVEQVAQDRRQRLVRAGV